MKRAAPRAWVVVCPEGRICPWPGCAGSSWAHFPKQPYSEREMADYVYGALENDPPGCGPHVVVGYRRERR